jgi:hypothetical protein
LESIYGLSKNKPRRRFGAFTGLVYSVSDDGSSSDAR